MVYDDLLLLINSMKNIYKLPLVLEPQPEGGYNITCPLITNLITEADKLEEVIPNVSDALAALIEAYEDLNQPLPQVLQLKLGRI